MRKFLTITLLFFVTTAWLSAGLLAQHKTDDILGYWFNEEKTSKVQIFKEGGKYYAKIVWLKEPNDPANGKPRVDNLNPEPKLQAVPLLGLVIMKDFTFNGSDEWKDGTIYDPKKGKTYSCYIQFDKPNVLKIRGYIGVSLLGRTTYWTKTVFQP